MKITDGSTVVLEYTLCLEDGEIIETTEWDEPLTYIQGAGEILPGLEQAVMGMKKGESKEMRLSADQAFGPHDPEALLEMPRSELPPELGEVGMVLMGLGPNGETLEGTVVELKKDSAVVDFNHPLAGKTLQCALKIADVRNDNKNRRKR